MSDIEYVTHQAHDMAPQALVARALNSFFATHEERQAALGSQPYEAPSPTLELLTFSVGGEHYALPVEHVAEVVRLGRITRVPQLNEASLGIISLRGQMVPVVVLGGVVGVEQAGTKAPRHVVVMRDSAPVGLAVDHVTGVLRVLTSAVMPPPPQGRGLLFGLCGSTQGALRILHHQALSKHLERMP